MKLASFESEGTVHVGIVVGEGVIDVAKAAPDLPRDMIGIIAEWPNIAPRMQAIAQQTQPHLKLSDVHLQAPVPRPSKIIASASIMPITWPRRAASRPRIRSGSQSSSMR